MTIITSHTVALVAAADVNAASVLAAHQANVQSSEAEAEVPDHKQPPYNHSIDQRSETAEPREYHHREIPGIINNDYIVIRIIISRFRDEPSRQSTTVVLMLKLKTQNNQTQTTIYVTQAH